MIGSTAQCTDTQINEPVHLNDQIKGCSIENRRITNISEGYSVVQESAVLGQVLLI